MTGTSLDGLDAALVRIDGRGLDMRATLVRAASRPLGDLAAPLRAFAEQAPKSAGEIAHLSHRFSVLHAEAMADLWRAARPEGAAPRPDLVASHGQTVFHAPPLSWQLLMPAVIAHALECPVVSDLRAADLAAGGQGAPITPLADWILFRDAGEARGVANLGGFCNLTLMGPAGAGIDSIRGFDLCACNHVLDTVARRVLGVPYDEGGRAAQAAEPDHDALDDLLGIFTAQRGAKRSLGTGDDDVMGWIGRHRARLSGAALAATACEAIGQMIAREAVCDRLILAGGGARNAALARAIASCCSCRVCGSADLGVPAEYREATCIAVLGALSQDRVPITLPRVTGVPRAPVAGSWVLP